MKGIFALMIVITGVVSAYCQDIKIDDTTRCDFVFRAYDNHNIPTVRAIGLYVLGVLASSTARV